jgi:hypothetical protein
MKFKINDKESLLIIERQDDPTDCNWCGNMSATLYNTENVRLCGIRLETLWVNLDQDCNNDQIHTKYVEGDFFQQNILSTEQRKDYASRLHDLLIKYKTNICAAGFLLRNIYSTNSEEDTGLFMSDSIVNFWNKRVAIGKAEYDESLKRFRIVWS